MTALTNTPLRVHPDLKLIASGKVREVYELDADHLLFVATDRVSAFDCVMANGIPGKGELLSMLSRWWFNFFKREMPELKTHFVSMGLPERLKKELSGDEVAAMQHRTMVTRKLEVCDRVPFIDLSTGRKHPSTNRLLSFPRPAVPGNSTALIAPLGW